MRDARWDRQHVALRQLVRAASGYGVGAQLAVAGSAYANHLAAGEDGRGALHDVLAIPAGVPHQFTRVSNPFLYFVVKVEV